MKAPAEPPAYSQQQHASLGVCHLGDGASGPGELPPFMPRGAEMSRPSEPCPNGRFLSQVSDDDGSH